MASASFTRNSSDQQGSDSNASDENESVISESFESFVEEYEDSGDEVYTGGGEIEPYTDEPLASDDDGEARELEDAVDDPDGLAPPVLEARFDRQVAVSEW